MHNLPDELDMEISASLFDYSIKCKQSNRMAFVIYDLYRPRTVFIHLKEEPKLDLERDTVLVRPQLYNMVPTGRASFDADI